MSLISLMNGITEIYGKGLFYGDGSVVFISLMNESQKSFKLASVCSKAIVLGFFFTSLTSLMKGITEICGYCLFLGNGLPISISLINGSTEIYS